VAAAVRLLRAGESAALKKALVILLLAAVAVAFAVFRKKADAPVVVFSKVTRETIASTLSTNGKVEPIEYMDVRAETSGVVRRVLVHLGDTVRAGHVVAELSQPGVAEDLQASEARVAQAHAALEVLRAGGRKSEQAALEGELNRLKGQRASDQMNLDSLQRLQRANAATLFEVEQARAVVKDLDVQIQSAEARRAAIVGPADLDAAQARLNEAEANLALAKTHLNQSTISVPLGGVVYDLPVRQGAYLNPGDAVASVGKLDPVRVRVYVDEPELGRVEPGQAVRITWDALAGREWTGKVQHKPVEVVALGSRQVGEVLCTIDNPNRDLTPGTNVNAFILTKVEQNALSIPRSALRRDNGMGVYVLEPDNTVKWRAVRAGVSDALRVQVSGGLSEGDRVAQPSDRPLKDGMPVNAVNQ
jgi:HlyD family secretion protein